MKTKSLFAALLLLFCAISLWASDTSIGGIWYNFYPSGLTASVTYQGSSYDKYSNEYTGTITIPSSVTYKGETYHVASIGQDAFRDCGRLTSITFPTSIISIGSGAFQGCSSLTSITIPSSVTKVGPSVFSNCHGLTSIAVEDGNPTYDSRNDCNAIIETATNKLIASCQSTIIPNSVTSIGDYAFYYCTEMTSIVIPDSVKYIGNYAFSYCSKLTSIVIPYGETYIKNGAFSYCSNLKHLTIPNSVIYIGKQAFAGCKSLTSITIPESVASISDEAFAGCGLTSITIPNRVGSISADAFVACNNLTSVTLNSNFIFSKTFTPSSNLNTIFGSQVTVYILGGEVTSIGDYTFYSSNMTSITIPKSVKRIGKSAFSSCRGLTSVAIPDSVTSIGQSAFQGCTSLTSVTIPHSITFIEDGTFSYCSGLTSITIPDSVTSIGNRAFYNCSSLTSATIPNNVTSIGGSAFEGCAGLKSVTIPNSTTSIGESTFSRCRSLTSITIPNSVVSIEGKTFSDCDSLKRIDLGVNLRIIEADAFKGCSSVDTITCYSMRPPTVNNAFDNLPYSTIVYVPADYMNTYKMHDFWGLYDVRPLGATSVQITDLQITPDDNTANVVWPTVENAATYEMIIKDKNGVIVCTLIFNANGQLTSIAFAAPGRSPASTQSAGFSFTVTGLDSGTLYDLTITAKDNSGNVLKSTTKSFATNGYTGIDNIESSAKFGGQKILRDGQLFILRDGKTYTVQGQELK